MADFIQQFDERVRELGGNWAKYSVVGSFLLYITGYLVLRFHLTALGVATDLAVLDERYLFAGARFLVYVVAAIPSLVLVGLPLLMAVWLLSRLAAGALRLRMRLALLQPARLVMVGVLFSVAVIQFVMRQCFFFTDLLLAPALPTQPAWMASLLLDDRWMPLYFAALVAAAAVTCLLLSASRPPEGSPLALRAGRALLALMAVIQVLLLPVNYGVLVVDKSLPRVLRIGDQPLEAGSKAWLIWEGKDSVTFLVRSQQGAQRSLLTLPRTEVKRLEVLGFDAIMPVLFAATLEAGK